MIFISFNWAKRNVSPLVGNLAKLEQTAYKAILSCSAISIVMILGLRFYLQWENKRRDTAQGVQIDAEGTREVDLQTDGALSSLDETDWENQSFRYVL